MTTSLMSPPRAAFSELIGDVERHDHVRLTPNTSGDASQQNAALNFRNGSISAEIRRLHHVRSAPNNGLIRFRAMNITHRAWKDMQTASQKAFAELQKGLADALSRFR